MKQNNKVEKYLSEAQEYADSNSGCKKVAVGSLLLPKGWSDSILIYGCNNTMPVSCKVYGCRRVELYGDDSKDHRLPSDCRSIHSEIDVIAQAAKYGYATKGAILIVTRYPCEACARAIVDAGIKEVYYGRQQAISDETEAIFKCGGVKCVHITTWDYEDTRR